MGKNTIVNSSMNLNKPSENNINASSIDKKQGNTIVLHQNKYFKEFLVFNYLLENSSTLLFTIIMRSYKTIETYDYFFYIYYE